MTKWLNKRYTIRVRGSKNYINDSLFYYHGTEQLISVLKGKCNKIIANIENLGHICEVSMTSEKDIGLKITEKLPYAEVVVGIFWIWVEEE